MLAAAGRAITTWLGNDARHHALYLLSLSPCHRDAGRKFFSVPGLPNNAEFVGYEGLGLGQYADAFEANVVHFRLLSSLTSEDLKDIGVSVAGQRVPGQRLFVLRVNRAQTRDSVVTDQRGPVTGCWGGGE